MSCNSDIATFSREGGTLYRFPANREEVIVDHFEGGVTLTLRFNDTSMSTTLTTLDACALAALLTSAEAAE